MQRVTWRSSTAWGGESGGIGVGAGRDGEWSGSESRSSLSIRRKSGNRAESSSHRGREARRALRWRQSCQIRSSDRNYYDAAARQLDFVIVCSGGNGSESMQGVGLLWKGYTIRNLTDGASGKVPEIFGEMV